MTNIYRTYAKRYFLFTKYTKLIYIRFMEKCEKDKVTRSDYCRYLLSSQINHTLTNFADHRERSGHDEISRYLSGDKIMPRLVWENVRGQIIQTPGAYIVSDDTILRTVFRHNALYYSSRYPNFFQCQPES
ncbi:MAG: hypothetical protein BWK80_26715 [Desulfobacteraceae bacterium IS3]|nr:MAG: hypothetical protein BWK80_26715 [Desulfobacteraceae bacterium IS3]HAO22897.1 hypothetical protein [Desulfobacteraceae bacterium]